MLYFGATENRVSPTANVALHLQIARTHKHTYSHAQETERVSVHHGCKHQVALARLMQVATKIGRHALARAPFFPRMSASRHAVKAAHAREIPKYTVVIGAAR
jgi:hypothetical protein